MMRNKPPALSSPMARSVIASECQRVGLPLPTTVQEGGYVVTTFQRPKLSGSGSNLDQYDPDPIQIDPDPDSTFHAKLLQTIRFNPLISRKVLADELGVSERKVRKALEELRNTGVVLRQGPEHGGIWRISIRQVDRNGSKSTENHTGNHTESTVDTILEIIKNDPFVAIARLCEKTGKSRPTINEHIANLKAKNLIRRVGPARGGHWEVL